MTDLRNRFRTLDERPTPDLWREAVARAEALPQRDVRAVPWVLIALTLLLVLAIAGAALIGSGVVKLPVFVSKSSLLPGPTREVRPTAIPSPTGPLGGGLILAYGAYDALHSDHLDVFTLDPDTGQQVLLGTLPAGFTDYQHRYNFQWGADHNHVLITNYNGEGPKQLDNQTDTARQLTFVCCEPPHEALPDNGKGDGTSPTQPAATGWVLSPQSNLIAGLHNGQIQVPGCLLCSAPDAIAILDVDSRNLRTLPLPAGTQGNGPVSWSPDGSAIVVSGCRPCNNAGVGRSGDVGKLTPTAVEHAHLFIVPIDGSPVRELLDGIETTFFSATWSPDGTTIALQRNACPPNEHAPYCEHGTVQLVTVSVADGRQTVVADALSDRLVWSPEGRRIAFSDDTSIFVMDADGSHLAKVSDGRQPAWSPDGAWLMFSTSDETLGTTIGPWIVAAGGGKPRLLGPYGGWAW